MQWQGREAGHGVRESRHPVRKSSLKNKTRGNPPGVSQPPSSLRISTKTCKHSATQPTVTTPTPGRPAKELQQKGLQNSTSPPPHPFPSWNHCKTSRTANHPNPPDCDNILPEPTSIKNFKDCKPPLPPTCFPPTGLQRRLQVLQTTPPIRLRPSRSSFKKRTSGTSELPFPTHLHPSNFKPAIDREESAPPPSLFHDLRIARSL